MLRFSRSALLALAAAVGASGITYACSRTGTARPFVGDDAARVYVAPGEHDEFYAFVSGGFNGQARDRGKTIVLTSHLMSALEELADTIVLLVDGRVQFVESVETLRVRTGQPNLERAVARLLTGADQPHAGPVAAGAAGPVSGNGSTPG